MTEHIRTAEFINAVLQADTGGPVDPHLVPQLSSGLSEESGVAGGYLVPTDLAKELWTSTYDSGMLMSLCSGIPVTRGNGVKVPAIGESSRADGQRLGGVRMRWTAEGDMAGSSQPSFRQINLVLKKLLGFAYATSELCEDIPALLAVLKRIYGLEAAFEIEDGIVDGDGMDRPLGMLRSGAMIEVGPGSATGGVSLLGSDVRGMYDRLWAPSRRRAVWLVNPEIETQLYDVGGGDYQGLPLFSWGSDGEPRVLGRPVIPHESCSAPGQRGDLILCDPSQYLLAEKEPKFLSSIDVRFAEQEQAFRFRYRVDGAPAWATPVTPKNGTQTVSAFVTLGART